MTQGPTAEAPSPTGAALRFGAVLAASGPVILTAFGVGRRSVGWFCSAPDLAGEGPYALESTPGELLFWAVLLLPVLLAGLLLRGSRRATPAAVAAVGVVLAFGLFTAFFLPGLDPCTARLRAVVPPWPLIVCYPVAAGTLLLAPRPPSARGSAPWTPVLWAGGGVGGDVPPPPDHGRQVRGHPLRRQHDAIALGRPRVVVLRR
ncbi:hypothetical protein GCM10010149_45030 [Nonomuraea roseoviolacea subsp. roseoviolacea]|uniref:hypothetical protein n=1 Tax=Nonomuraea roseoviolacea TaxID=103837 RepID=UPI0031D37D55